MVNGAVHVSHAMQHAVLHTASFVQQVVRFSTLYSEFSIPIRLAIAYPVVRVRGEWRGKLWTTFPNANSMDHARASTHITVVV